MESATDDYLTKLIDDVQALLGKLLEVRQGLQHPTSNSARRSKSSLPSKAQNQDTLYPVFETLDYIASEVESLRNKLTNPRSIVSSTTIISKFANQNKQEKVTIPTTPTLEPNGPEPENTTPPKMSSPTPGPTTPAFELENTTKMTTSTPEPDKSETDTTSLKLDESELVATLITTAGDIPPYIVRGDRATTAPPLCCSFRVEEMRGSMVLTMTIKKAIASFT